MRKHESDFVKLVRFRMLSRSFKSKLGPHLRPLCVYCETEVPANRRSWCSEKCISSWHLMTNPRIIRRALLKRDKGICALCSLDCRALDKAFRTADPAILIEAVRDPCVLEQFALDEDFDKICAAVETIKAAPEWCQSRAVCMGRRRRGKKQLRRRSMFDVDHTIPLVEGGAMSLDNLRILCIRCHSGETAKLRKRLQEARKG